MDLEDRVADKAFREPPAVRVGLLGQYELIQRRNRNVFGNVIGIATGNAEDSQNEEDKSTKRSVHGDPCLCAGSGDLKRTKRTIYMMIPV